MEHTIQKGYNRADHDEFVITMGPEYVSWSFCISFHLTLACRGYPPELDSECEKTVSNSKAIGLDHGMLDKIFPWHFAFDDSLQVTSIGSMLAERLSSCPISKPLREIFRMQRPLEAKYQFEDFKMRGTTEHLDFLCILFMFLF